MRIGGLVAVVGIALVLVSLAGAFGVPGLCVAGPNGCIGGTPFISLNPLGWHFSGLSGSFSVNGAENGLGAITVAITVNGASAISTTASVCGALTVGKGFCASPAYSFGSAGTYSVKVTAAGTNGGTTYKSTSPVYAVAVVQGNATVKGAIQASFTYTQNTGSETVVLTDTSTATNGARVSEINTKWVVSGSIVAVESPASYTFATFGVFSVTDQVAGFNANGTNVYNSTTQAVTVVAPGCTQSCYASISPSFSWTTTNLTVQVTDTSTVSNGVLIQEAWSFGDSGSVQLGKSLSHTYATAGNYTVTENLTVQNAQGLTQYASASHTVSVSSPPPTNCQQTSSCPPPPPCQNGCSTGGSTGFSLNALNGALLFGGFGLVLLGAIVALSRHPALIVVGGVLFVVLTAAGYFLGGAGLL